MHHLKLHWNAGVGDGCYKLYVSGDEEIEAGTFREALARISTSIGTKLGSLSSKYIVCSFVLADVGKPIALSQGDVYGDFLDSVNIQGGLITDIPDDWIQEIRTDVHVDGRVIVNSSYNPPEREPNPPFRVKGSSIAWYGRVGPYRLHARSREESDVPISSEVLETFLKSIIATLRRLGCQFAITRIDISDKTGPLALSSDVFANFLDSLNAEGDLLDRISKPSAKRLRIESYVPERLSIHLKSYYVRKVLDIQLPDRSGQSCNKTR